MREALGEDGAAALEQFEARGGLEVAAHASFSANVRSSSPASSASSSSSKRTSPRSVMRYAFRVRRLVFGP